MKATGYILNEDGLRAQPKVAQSRIRRKGFFREILLARKPGTLTALTWMQMSAGSPQPRMLSEMIPPT